jgi:hypothetical protein
MTIITHDTLHVTYQKYPDIGHIPPQNVNFPKNSVAFRFLRRDVRPSSADIFLWFAMVPQVA